MRGSTACEARTRDRAAHHAPPYATRCHQMRLCLCSRRAASTRRRATPRPTCYPCPPAPLHPHRRRAPHRGAGRAERFKRALQLERERKRSLEQHLRIEKLALKAEAGAFGDSVSA